MRRKRHAGGDGDHAGASEMEIKGTRKGYTMSHIKLHVMFDVYPFMNLIACLDLIATVA